MLYLQSEALVFEPRAPSVHGRRGRGLPGTAERVRVIVYRKSRLFGSAEVGWCEVALDDLPQGQPLRRTKKLIVGSGNSDSDTLEISCRVCAPDEPIL